MKKNFFQKSGALEEWISHHHSVIIYNLQSVNKTQFKDKVISGLKILSEGKC